eukprot:GHUV01007127.1.p1 GENE.GHUV01007127.1~~GHUV01007127.1.p1  ORF type:complete len:917 (+),score=306.36 GHUV01007127.1:275-3025(+)
MERATARDTEPTPQAQSAEDYSVGTSDETGRQEPASAAPAQHGPGPPASSSTPVAQLEPVASTTAEGSVPEAEQQIDLLKAELAAVKQSLATYESTLQQLLGGPHVQYTVPSALQQMQRTVAVTEGIGVQHDIAGQSLSEPAPMQQQMEQRPVAQAALEQSIEPQQAFTNIAVALEPGQQQAGPAGADLLLASGVAPVELGQRDASASTPPATGAQRSLLTSLVATAGQESRLQASASAPSFTEQVAAASSAQQPTLSIPVVQRRSTFGTAETASASGFDFLQHSSPGTGISGIVRPPSSLALAPTAAGLAQDISFTRQQQLQQYLDASSSQVQQAGPSGPVSIPVGIRSSSPSLAAGYATSPGIAGNVVTGQAQAAPGGLLPPLPGRPGRQSDPTSAAPVAGRVISPPGSGNLALSPPGSGSLATPALEALGIAAPAQQQLPGSSLAHLGAMQSDTAGSLSLSPDTLGLGAAAAEAAGRVASIPSYEAPDVMPGRTATGADQFTSQQLQALLQQQGHGQEAAAAEQLALLQHFYQQQQQGFTADVQQQQLLAAMSQLNIKDPAVACMMAASAISTTAAGQGGALGVQQHTAGPLGAGWDPAAAAAAALAAAGGLDSASQAALQQEALQAQALAQMQAQAQADVFQQVQMAQQLQQLQQQQYNPYLQQLLAAQAASLWQQPGQAGLWPPGFLGASSSSARRGSRGADVQPSGTRDVRKGADRGTRGAAAAGPSAGSGRQPRTSDEPDWRRIFVGNIGWWVDEQMLQRIFGEYGTILDAQVSCWLLGGWGTSCDCGHLWTLKISSVSGFVRLDVAAWGSLCTPAGQLEFAAALWQPGSRARSCARLYRLAARFLNSSWCRIAGHVEHQAAGERQTCQPRVCFHQLCNTRGSRQRYTLAEWQIHRRYHQRQGWPYSAV